MQSLKKFIISFASTLLIAVLVGGFVAAPMSAEEEGCEDCGQGQGNSGPPPESTPESPAPGGSAPEDGGRRGHETNRLSALAYFLGTRVYGLPLDVVEGDLTSTEFLFLCRMKAAVQTGSDRIVTLNWFAEFLAALMNRPLPMIRTVMLSEEDGCVTKLDRF